MTLLSIYIDLNKFMDRLDKRYQDKVSKEGGTVARKIRKQGAPSASFPPVDAPEWTVVAGKTVPFNSH